MDKYLCKLAFVSEKVNYLSLSAAIVVGRSHHSTLKPITTASHELLREPTQVRMI